MDKTIELKWCDDDSCTVRPHAVNCPKCFGFGFTEGRGLISASVAFDWKILTPFVTCDVCGGYPRAPLSRPGITFSDEQKERIRALSG